MINNISPISVVDVVHPQERGRGFNCYENPNLDKALGYRLKLFLSAVIEKMSLPPNSGRFLKTSLIEPNISTFFC